MVLVVVRAEEAPVDVQTLSIYQGAKLQECQFRVGSKLEHYFFRVRQLDGTIMRYETPDYYFLPIMRNLLNAAGGKAAQKWGEEDGAEEVTITNAAQRVRANRFVADATTTAALRDMLANYDRALAVWKLRRSAHGDLAAAGFTDSYASDASETDSETG